MLIESLIALPLLSAFLPEDPGANPGAAAAPKNLFALAAGEGRFEALLATVEAAGLAPALTGPDSLTLLAPTDGAFSRVEPRVVASLFEPGNRSALRRLLLGHVVAGDVTAMDALTRGTVTTLAGDVLTVAIEGGRLTIGGAAVIDTDLVADNGRVHALEGVIVADASCLQPTAERRLAAAALDRAQGLDDAGRAAVLEVGALALAERDGAAEFLGASLVAARSEATDAGRARVLGAALGRILGRGPGEGAAMGNDPELMGLVEFDGDDGGVSWFTLNDDVMGGISSSRFTRTEGGIGVFSGALSLENNGGFATIRSSAGAYDLQDQRGIRVRVRGDGREYGLSVLAGDERGRERSWRKKFIVPDGEWAEIDVPFEDMVLNIRGRQFPDVGPPKREAIRSFSFIIADKNEDPFRLEIDWIRAYR